MCASLCRRVVIGGRQTTFWGCQPMRWQPIAKHMWGSIAFDITGLGNELHSELQRMGSVTNPLIDIVNAEVADLLRTWGVTSEPFKLHG